MAWTWAPCSSMASRPSAVCSITLRRRRALAQCSRRGCIPARTSVSCNGLSPVFWCLRALTEGLLLLADKAMKWTSHSGGCWMEPTGRGVGGTAYHSPPLIFDLSVDEAESTLVR